MRREREAGAAAVEFVLISVLLVLLLFGVLQVAAYFYARNVVAASAADAARYAAASGVPVSAGGARAEHLIRQALGTQSIRCTSKAGTDAGSGLPVTSVHCTGRVRALLVAVDVPLRLDFTSSALKEDRR